MRSIGMDRAGLVRCLSEQSASGKGRAIDALLLAELDGPDGLGQEARLLSALSATIGPGLQMAMAGRWTDAKRAVCPGCMAGIKNRGSGSGGGVEEDGDRPVIHQRHLHVGAENARFNREALAPQHGAEMLIETLTLVRGRGLRETRAIAAFHTLRGQRELTDRQNRAINGR